MDSQPQPDSNKPDSLADGTRKLDLLKGTEPTVVHEPAAAADQTPAQPLNQTPEDPASGPITEKQLMAMEPEDKEEKKRRRLVFLLVLLVLLFCCIGALFVRYVENPRPLPDMIPPFAVTYRPHYLFSIYGLDRPVGVTVSPDEQYIYVSESAGERLVKVFDRDGNSQFNFAPPRTTSASRSPVYLATDNTGRVFVVDRLQHAIFAYSAGGVYLDTLLHYDLALSEYIAQHTGAPPNGIPFAYNLFEQSVVYRPVTATEDESLPGPNLANLWAPLGIRIDPNNHVYVTDTGEHNIREFNLPQETMLTAWHSSNPEAVFFGESGQGNGQFLFPNTAMADSQGRIYISDGNNGRISVWDKQRIFLYNFGAGSGEGALSLPRGLFINERDQLYVVDAVGQAVMVYDISGEEPVFLYSFGEAGVEDGQFNYPSDIFVDQTGRLYIVDRDNHRVQVWSY